MKGYITFLVGMILIAGLVINSKMSQCQPEEGDRSGGLYGCVLSFPMSVLYAVIVPILIISGVYLMIRESNEYFKQVEEDIAG